MRSTGVVSPGDAQSRREPVRRRAAGQLPDEEGVVVCRLVEAVVAARAAAVTGRVHVDLDRKSTRLNSSHVSISYAVFCLKKKKNKHTLSEEIRRGLINYDVMEKSTGMVIVCITLPVPSFLVDRTHTQTVPLQSDVLTQVA